MATDAQSLLSEANCYSCHAANEFTATLLKLGLLRQILLASDPMADTSPQTLLAAANCYSCYASNPFTLSMMELALLAQIAGGSGTGGLSGQLVLYTTTDPTTDGVVPSNLNLPALAYRADGTQPLFNWDPVAHIWT